MAVAYPVQYPDAADFLIVAGAVLGIPAQDAFDLVDRRRLSQALETPRFEVDCVDLFDELLAKVAAYGWQLLRRPPIPNKRRASRAIAYLCMDLFLGAHDLELRGGARNVERVLGEVGSFDLSVEGLYTWLRTWARGRLPEANQPDRLVPIATAEGKFLGRKQEVFSRLQLDFSGEGWFLGEPITVLATLWQVGPTPTRVRRGSRCSGVKFASMSRVPIRASSPWKGGFVGCGHNDGYASRARATGLLVEISDEAPAKLFMMEGVASVIQVDVERSLKYRLKMWALPMSAV